MITIPSVHTTTVVLASLGLLGTVTSTPSHPKIPTGWIPKRARSSSLAKRHGDEPVKPIFRLGLVEGREVQLVHQSQPDRHQRQERSGELFGRAEGGTEVVGSINQLHARSG
jgi:hypothetical protein